MAVEGGLYVSCKYKTNSIINMNNHSNWTIITITTNNKCLAYFMFEINQIKQK